MPVTNKGFEEYLPDAINTLESPRYKSLYNTFVDMQKNYSFYTPPQYSFYLNKETLIENNTRQILSEEAVSFRENSISGATLTDADQKENDKMISDYSRDALNKLKDIME